MSSMKKLPLDSHTKCEQFLDWDLLTVGMCVFLGLWWAHLSPVHMVYIPSAFVNKLFELEMP